MSGFISCCNKLLILMPLIFSLNFQLYADFVPLLGSDHFGDSLRYPYSSKAGYMIKDMDPSEAASRNGIIFRGEGESSLTTHKVEDFYSLAGVYVGERVIEHFPAGKSSAGEGIVISFKYPVRKFGVNLGRASIVANLDPDPESASLRAYSAAGQLIGTTEVGSITYGPLNEDTRLEEHIFGFEITDGPGVITVVLDYGQSEITEKIDFVYYRYTSPHPFKVILPQIAHGSVSGASIECDLTLFWDDSAAVSVISPSGVSLASQILDEGSEFSLESEPRTSRQEFFKSSTIPGLDDLTVGYVVAESDYPIDGQIVYRTTDADGKVYEADIRGCVPENYLQIPFELNQAENLNAALAIVNPSDTVAEIEIHVNDADQSYTEFWEPPTFTLQPGEQRALFMWELWNEMPSEDGNYILQLRSAVPFAAAAFYTRNWIVVGNLPVWSYKEGQAR